MLIPSRDKESWPGMTHFGFNGMERDDDIAGRGNSYDFGARMYDPRVARWKSLDPKMAKYPGISPLVAFNNNPVLYVDPDGKEIVLSFADTTGKYKKEFIDISDNLKTLSYIYKAVYEITDNDEDKIVVSEYTKEDSENERTKKARGYYRLFNGFFFSSESTEIRINHSPIRYGFRNSTIFEEVFHSAQDQFYFPRRSSVEIEIEAKMAKVFTAYSLASDKKSLNSIEKSLDEFGIQGYEKLILIKDGKINKDIQNYFDAIINKKPINNEMKDKFQKALVEYSKSEKLNSAYKFKEDELDDYLGNTKFFDELSGSIFDKRRNPPEFDTGTFKWQ